MYFPLHMFALGSDQTAGSRVDRFVRKNYHEVYGPLVQAVLEGDIDKFNQALESDRDSLQQKLPFGRNLRHIAYKRVIDKKLLALGVAPKQEIDFYLISSELGSRYAGRCASRKSCER